MTVKVELRPERALEALTEVDTAIFRGERPTVIVDNIEGLSPEFVKHMLGRDDVELILSETAASQLDVSANQMAPSRRAVYAAVALVTLLISAGAGLLLSR